MTSIDYRRSSIAVLLLSAGLLLVTLIGLPLYILLGHAPQQYGHAAGKVIVAPFMGAFYLFFVARAFVQNRRLKLEPRAIVAGPTGVTWWKMGKPHHLDWSQIAGFSADRPKNAVRSYLVLRVVGESVATPIRFEIRRLDVVGRSAEALAAELAAERVQDENPAP